jgi:hypothetical protein
MSLKEKIEQLAYDTDSPIIFFDYFEEAIIGVELEEMRVIYSVSKCLEILNKEMSEEEADEYFEFNVRGSKMGTHTPIFCDDKF